MFRGGSKRPLVSWLAVLAAAGSTLVVTPAEAFSTATPQASDLTPVDMTWLLPPPQPTEDSSRFVVNDSQIVGSLILGASEVWAQERNPLPDAPDNFDQFYCDSYDDKPCRGRELWVRSHLPPCSETVSAQCVVGVTFTQGVREYPAEFVRYLDFSGTPRLEELGKHPDGPEFLEMHPVIDFASDDERGLPAGTRVGLWKVPGLIEGKDRFIAVDVGMAVHVTADGVAEVGQFGAGVTPVLAEARASSAAPALVSVRDPNGHLGVGGSGMDGWYEDCAYRDVNDCFRRTAFPADTTVTLTAQLTSQVTGWLHGRIVEPEISIRRLDAATNRLSVSGRPASVPATQKSIPNRVLPPQWAMQREPWFTGDGIWHPGTVLSATDSHQFRWFKGILPWLGDRADAELPTWSFRAVEVRGNLNRCMASSTELMGLVTTNAMMYDGGPPDFDGKSLSYGVAGLHLASTGDLARGNYSLVMRSDAARCLYGFSEAPIKAEISVVSEDGAEQVATTSMSEGGGWLRLTAENFTFSSPTIEMTLNGRAQKVQVTCVKVKKKTKGPKKVVVTGTSAKPPTCPKGYRAS